MTFHVKLLGERPADAPIAAGRPRTIGRGGDVDILVDAEGVASVHCELEVTATGLLVRDRSGGDTRVNGQPPAEGGTEARPGDQIAVGTAHLVVERPPDADLMRRPTGRPLAGRIRRDNFPVLRGYDLLELLGEGTTGDVYRALTREDRRPVALRALKPLASEALVTRFLRSARALIGFEHPNVVEFVDVSGEDQDAPFIAMELLRGPTLHELCDGGPLGPREALTFGAQVARALAAIHDRGLVHRNVAPRHLLVLAGGIVKLTGFTVVKVRDDEAQLTNLSDIIGSLTYSSPEQAQHPNDVDHRADLYSLGAVLFHALAGNPPFVGKEIEVFRRVLQETPPALSDLVPTAPATLSDAVARLLEKKPEDRLATASDVERILVDALAATCRTPDGRLRSGYVGSELLEIVRHLEHAAADGRLRVVAPGVTGEIVLAEGVIVDASATGPLEGEAAVMALLDTLEGTFELLAELPPPPERRIAMSATAAALTASRRRVAAAT